MKLYSVPPDTWQSLQTKVAQLLGEVGYETKVEKDIKTPRGTVNVDVLAISKNEIPKNTILCECKHWRHPVPKTIVHSFRTVVTDFGAHHGFIISKAGFQAGSYEAVQHTNVSLMDWEGFENYFKVRWLTAKQFSVSRTTKPLYDYVSVGFTVFFKEEYNQLSADEKSQYERLTNKYFHISFHASNLNFRNPETNEFDPIFFESLFRAAEKDLKNKFESYEAYYTFLVEQAKDGVEEFDQLFKQQLRRMEKEINDITITCRAR